MIGTITVRDEISGRMTVSNLLSFSWAGGLSLVDRYREGTAREEAVPRIVFIMPVEKKRSTYQSTEVFSSQWETVFTPRTDLGKKLYALRARAIASGMKLLSEEEVLEEIKRRRGEVEGNEKDLY